jgi:hypothetical protein
MKDGASALGFRSPLGLMKFCVALLRKKVVNDVLTTLI